MLKIANLLFFFTHPQTVQCFFLTIVYFKTNKAQHKGIGPCLTSRDRPQRLQLGVPKKMPGGLQRESHWDANSFIDVNDVLEPVD